MKKTIATLLGAALVTCAVSGCKNDDKKGGDAPKAGATAATAKVGDAKPDPKAAPPPAPPPPPKLDIKEDLTKKTCADWGAEGKGDFSEPCRFKDAAPFEATFTGRYETNVFNEEAPVLSVTNKFAHTVSWGNISLWYYDKAGNQLELKGQDGSTFKRFYQNGSGMLPLKPGETKELKIGMPKASVPPETDSIYVEVTGWGWDDEPKMYFSARSEVMDWDTRPKDGWK